jgi:acetyl-CoA carboxylase biotin carboxyl carrier protein
VPDGSAAPNARPSRSSTGRRDDDKARSLASVTADVAAIESLIDRLLPALTAKLASTRLGELEVREGEWRIRLRRPATAGSWNGELRRTTDKPSRSQPAHDGHHARGAAEGHAATTNGTGRSGTHAPARSAGAASGHGAPEDDPTRRIARSPAVGVFAPSSRAAVGSRVREGDVIGHIDVLGVAQDVVAPVDGLVAELLVENGTAVEYGQELILVQVPAMAEAR